jgi:hypothetical protein
MSGDHVLPTIYQDRDIETECLDTPSDLLNLLVAVDSRVLWMRFERRGRKVRYFQSRVGRWHMEPQFARNAQ